jgi:amidase
MDELAFYPATKLAQMIRTGEVSSSELLELYLARIERLNSRINAVVTLDAERARRQARQADALRSKGESLGPLHGVPITIKDAFETAGLPTTCGAPHLKDYIPAANAMAVQRYLDAGAIVFGKTNCPLFCSNSQTYNDIFGRTNNPWDLERSPGGSSGGAAAALAAGLTALELGSDIAGSIRIPASWSGVYGHKPSYGIIPQQGHIPPPPGTSSTTDLNCIGPLARSAADLVLALDCLIGPAPVTKGSPPADAIGWTFRLPQPRAASLKGYRIAAWLDDEDIPVDTQVKACLEAVIDALRAASARIDEQARPGFKAAEAGRTFQKLMYPALFGWIPPALYDTLERLAQTGDAEADSETGRFAQAVTQRHREWLVADAERQVYRAHWAAFFKSYDVLLCPVASVPAIPHTISKSEMALERTIMVNNQPAPYTILQRWIGLPTLAYLPATSAPIGRTKEGLPIGMQIVGPFLEDRTPLDFAARLADIIGGFAPPPDF